MRKWLFRLILFIVISFVLVCAATIALVVALRFSLPTSETLVHWYLNEVAHGTTAELDSQYLRCRAVHLERDRELYRGAEFRRIIFDETHGSSGSGERLRLLDVSFEFRGPNATEWQRGELPTLLMTDFEPLHTRHLTCVM